jgi:cyclohexanecarboxylate-CoA ligase
VEICGDPPNYYRIVGRCKDIINRGGMKISPAEIDILLEGFPNLVEGAVCSYADETLGERVCACIVAKADVEPPRLEEINAYLNDQGLAKFKLPEKMILIDALPRNPLGKVQRNLLEEKVRNHG